MAKSGNLDPGKTGFFQTHFFCGFLKNGTRAIFRNLKFSKRKKQKWCLKKSIFFETLLKSKSPLSAIHRIISHIGEDGSRKVNNGEPDLRFLSRKLLTCYKPCRSKTSFFDLNQGGAKPENTEAPPPCGSHQQGKTREHLSAILLCGSCRPPVAPKPGACVYIDLLGPE